jgi:hypothetical protein
LTTSRSQQASSLVPGGQVVDGAEYSAYWTLTVVIGVNRDVLPEWHVVGQQVRAFFIVEDRQRQLVDGPVITLAGHLEAPAFGLVACIVKIDEFFFMVNLDVFDPGFQNQHMYSRSAAPVNFRWSLVDSTRNGSCF